MTEWSLAICGDWAPSDGLSRAILTAPPSFYGDLLPILQEADVAAVNLEGSLWADTAAPIVKDGVSLRLAPDLVAGLTVVPFRLACLANNHILDFGAEGLLRTRELLQRHGIAAVGAGGNLSEATAPWLFTVGENVQLAVLNVAEGEESRSVDGGPGAAPFDLPSVVGQIIEARKYVDVIVVVVHAGREHLPVPAPYVRTAYRTLVEAGANWVVAHHPHVPQGIEIYHNVPIIYSLGNLALWMGTSMPYHYLGLVAKAKFQGSKLATWEVYPYRIGADRLHLLKGDDRTVFLSELQELSALITEDDKLEAVWEAYADRWFQLQAERELAGMVVPLAGTDRVMQALLQGALPGIAERRWDRRVLRSLLWRSIHWFERRGSTRHKPLSATAAAVLRNRFDTQAHRELYLTALRRVMAGRAGSAPDWAYHLLDKWQVFG